MPTKLQAAIAALAAAATEAETGAEAPAGGAPDPIAGIGAANATIRETAKWMITSFAAIGGVLVAGLSLSSLGALTGDTPDERVAAAIAGVVLAVVGVTIPIWFTVSVLSPFLNTFTSADEHMDIVREVFGSEDLPSEVLSGISYTALKAEIASADQNVLAAGPDEEYRQALAERAGWEPPRRLALALVGSRLLDRRFERARFAIVAGVALAACGVGLFAWGSHAPASASDAPVALGQVPVRERLHLSAAGVAALAPARGCRRPDLTVLAIGGTEGNREVVTVPTRDCRSIRFVLTPAIGTPTGAGRAR
ncbi:MAG: hypothetical protein QOJ35_2276 [Solirubrobacteraceae bacterium]|nr:hypothetical protein [Solirubrobacteraceae bacterium]